jgi:uncharacterized protein (DUF58 family)
MLYVLVPLIVIVVAILFFVTSFWGGAIGLVLGILLILYLVSARKTDPSVGTIERGRRQEPTGTVRSGSPGVTTSNQRQGQE